MWGWLTAAYLFFGGLSAGTFIMSALLQLAHGNRFIRTVRVGSVLTLCFLVAGAALLLADVGLPMRAINIFLSFQNIDTSWMARGAWTLMGCGIVFAFYGLIAILPWEKMHLPAVARCRAALLNILGFIGIAAATFLALYTGLLLMDASGVPAWQTWLIPLLFLLSASDTGLALIAALFRRIEPYGSYWLMTMRRLDILLIVFLTIEVVMFGAYLVLIMEDGATLQAMLQVFSNESTLFLLIMTCLALLTALALAAAQLFPPRGGMPLATAAAAASLVGGILLRGLVLALGIHGALVPALVFWA